MNKTVQSQVYVYLGGTRSGKSRLAEQRALKESSGPKECSGQVLYVATAENCAQDGAQDVAHDAAMQERIASHKQRRPESWQLVECPLNIAAVLEIQLQNTLQSQNSTAQPCVVLVDCVTLWVSNILFSLMQEGVIGNNDTVPSRKVFEERIRAEVQGLLALREKYACTWIFVSGETGLGGIGATALERTFHDGLGLANELLVEASQEAYFVIAGRGLRL